MGGGRACFRLDFVGVGVFTGLALLKATAILTTTVTTTAPTETPTINAILTPPWGSVAGSGVVTGAAVVVETDVEVVYEVTVLMEVAAEVTGSSVVTP